MADSQGITLEEALNTFTQNTHSVLANAGKTPVVWEGHLRQVYPGNHLLTWLLQRWPLNIKSISEMTLLSCGCPISSSQPPPAADWYHRVWISSEHVGAVAQKGFRLIHAASDFFYLDCGGGGWLGNNIDGDSSCGVYKTWQKSYSFNPTNGLSDDQFDLIMGGMAPFFFLGCLSLSREIDRSATFMGWTIQPIEPWLAGMAAHCFFSGIVLVGPWRRRENCAAKVTRGRVPLRSKRCWRYCTPAWVVRLEAECMWCRCMIEDNWCCVDLPSTKELFWIRRYVLQNLYW